MEKCNSESENFSFSLELLTKQSVFLNELAQVKKTSFTKHVFLSTVN